MPLKGEIVLLQTGGNKFPAFLKKFFVVAFIHFYRFKRNTVFLYFLFVICNISNSSLEALSSFDLNIKDIAKIVIRRFLSNLYINFRLNVSVIRHLVILPFS